ncbi:putative white-brown complex protein 30 [Achaetomium macrosporum]|uniref:White-brown complex protein 30 n=1 Tax=Achaetomium macrosporum TaxID=79813 RepID=A0AAN7HBW1_9PEZI|nr:putative white-brown complex protein 30 [Achaetomium macrosporum]
MVAATSGVNITKLWEIDPALLPNGPNSPQVPFLPLRRPIGPSFLDTEACLCNRQPRPGTPVTPADGTPEFLWRCVGDRTEGANTATTGKWFRPRHDDKGELSDMTRIPVNDAANPPDTSVSLQWDSVSGSLVPGSGNLSVWDRACTGENHTAFSTSFYRATNQIERGEAPVDAAPCWRLGAVPLQIQNVSHWEANGCLPGFLCANNTVNSLPQYCPPFNECQGARLGSLQCIVNDTIGAVTPTPCAIGSYCPEGSMYQRCLIPIGIMAAIDLFVLIGVLVLRLRKSVRARAQEHRRSIWSDPKTAGDEIANVADTDLEAGEPSARVDQGDDGVLTSARNTLESSLSPEIRAFVESMRKAADGTDFSLSFGYSELTCQPKGSEEPILQNISGSIRGGSLTAIMGGSGAGKSTFVNVLMGKVECARGEITINGVPAKLQRYKKLIGYVPQDDIVLPEMTVYENILHSARIRLPRAWGEDDIRAHVDSVIRCLELSHVKDSMVGSVGKPTISGGQRKRVSIGVELAAAPMAIFLDEPTSGLDATAASCIMCMLKAITRLGVTVVVIIHQPRVEIFDMIDDLILLANGQQLYEGPESGVRPFFEKLGYIFPKHANCADVVTDIITGNGRPYKGTGDISKAQLVAHWRASRSGAPSTNGTPDPSFPAAGDWTGSGTTTEVPSRATSPSPPNPMLDGNSSDTEDRERDSGKESTNSADSANIDASTSPPESRPSPKPALFRSRFRKHTIPLPSAYSTFRASITAITPAIFPHHNRIEMSSNPHHKLILQHLTQTNKTRGAPRLRQTLLCLSRALLQQYRDLPNLILELGLAALAGFLLGLAESPKKGVLFLAPHHAPYDILSVSMDVKSAPEMALLTAIAIGLVSSAPGVRFFSEEMLLHRREARAGHSRLAYFVAKNVSVLPRVVVVCLHFSAPLLLLSVPIVPWGLAFGANLLYFYCVYGLASCVSMVVRREAAPLVATMVSLIVGILSGAAPSLSSVKSWYVHLEWLWRASPGVWLAEFYFGQLVNPLRLIYDADLAAALTGFDLEGLGRNLGVLVVIGTIYRVIAFVGLVSGENIRI